MTEVTANLRELAKQINEQEAAITRVAQAIEDTRQGFSLASSELTATVKSLEGYKRLSEDSKIKAADLQVSLIEASEQSRAASRDFGILQEVANNFSKESEDTLRKIGDLRNSFVEMVQQLEDISKGTAVDIRLEAINRVAEDLNRRLGGLNEQVIALEQRLDTRNQLEETHARAIAGLEGKLEILDGAVSNSVKQVESLLAHHAAKNTEMVNAIDGHLRTQHEHWSAAALAFDSRARDIGNQLEEAHARAIAGLEGKLEILNGAVSASVKQVESLLADHAAKTSETIGTLHSLLDVRQRSWAEAAAVLESRIEAAGRSIDAEMARRESFLGKVLTAIERLILLLPNRSREAK